MIFIDGSNLYHGLKSNFGRTDIDFERFCENLAEGVGHLSRIYYYNAPINQSDDPEGYKKQQQFFERLHRVPYLDLHLGRLEKRVKKRQTYAVEKGVDVKIALDMLRLAYANAYDAAILVSGDGDFADVLEEVKRLGKHCHVAYFAKGRSDQLRQAADTFIELTEGFLRECWLSEGGAAGAGHRGSSA